MYCRGAGRLPQPAHLGRYHGVYLHTRHLHDRTGYRYVARAFRKRRVGTDTNPREAAAAVAAWWRHRYGRGWVEHVRNRHRPGWEAIPVPLGDRPDGAAGFDLLDDGWGQAGDIAGRPAARTGHGEPVVWTWRGGQWVRVAGKRPGEAFAAVAGPGGVPTRVQPPAAGDLFARPTDAGHAVRSWVTAMAAAGTPVELLPAQMPTRLVVDDDSHPAVVDFDGRRPAPVAGIEQATCPRSRRCRSRR